MVSYRIRGARLVYRTIATEVDPADITFQGNSLSTDFAYRPIATRPVVTRPSYFIDGDIIEFPQQLRVIIHEDGSEETIDKQYFRLGNNGSTLTPVARGSWETK